MMPPLVAALVAFAATWEAWRWYAGRVAAAPEEAAALVLTVVFLAGTAFVRRGATAAEQPLPLTLVAVLLGIYAASSWVAPDIVRAAIAVATVLYCLHYAAFRHGPPVAFWGLVALALPVLPSLQFVLGYPMRMVSAALTVVLLQLQGLQVVQDGTSLVWRGLPVQFDAPCSGVNMLWAALLLALMASVVLRLRLARTLAVCAVAVTSAVAFNALRAASLFYVEARIVRAAPAWWHEGVGVVAFVLAAVLIVWTSLRLQQRRDVVP